MSASVSFALSVYSAPHVCADDRVAMRHDVPTITPMNSQATIASDFAVMVGRL
jgi:hypothetical protein